jgi:hypothetical protein
MKVNLSWLLRSPEDSWVLHLFELLYFIYLFNEGEPELAAKEPRG